MIDKQGKIWGRVSIIDIVVIVGLVAIGLGLLYRQTADHLDHIVSQERPFYLTLHAARLRHFTADAVNVGDLMWREHETTPLGRVVDVRREPAMGFLNMRDGTALFTEMEHRYDVFITIAAVGSETTDGFFANSVTHMSPGRELQVVTNRVFIGNARVWEVRNVRLD